MIKGFAVIDTLTGQRADYTKIAHENWASALDPYDLVEQFYIGEDGKLLLMDNRGSMAIPPAGRFTIQAADRPAIGQTAFLSSRNKRGNVIQGEITEIRRYESERTVNHLVTLRTKVGTEVTSLSAYWMVKAFPTAEEALVNINGKRKQEE